MRNPLLEKLIEKRFQGRDAIQQVFKDESKRHRPGEPRRRPFRKHDDGTRELKGVYRGNYYRVKVPDMTQAQTPRLSRLPATAPAPDLSALVADATARSAKRKSNKKLTDQTPTMAKIQQHKTDNAWKQFTDWVTTNAGTLLLNFGSLCTLAAFTRSDVLELRTLSTTGSVCNAVYHALNKTSNWWSVIWPGIFASVNGYNIMRILEERNAVVHLDEEQEKIYVEYFMPHGITPKQFERLEEKAEVLEFPKDSVIIRKNVTKVDHVYLVVKGSTSASILGRHLSSHSVSSDRRGSEKPGGDSGVWIGEMKFLDAMWEKDQEAIARQIEQKKAKADSKCKRVSGDTTDEHLVTEENDNGNQADMPSKSAKSAGETENSRLALYTIVAKEDCVVWRWSFDDMEKLMSSSTVSGKGLSNDLVG
jgi:CRP-like cAMP-binding protein